MQQKAFQNHFCFINFASLPVKALLWRTKASYFINSLILLHFWKDTFPAEECRMAYFRLQENQLKCNFNSIANRFRMKQNERTDFIVRS